MLGHSVIFAAVASLALLTAPASARIWAGGVDMEAACHDQYGPDYRAIVLDNSAFDWYCLDPDGVTDHPVDVQRYCCVTYGNNPYADPQGGGASDWGCYWCGTDPCRSFC